ncbi:MAG: excinuclease ABC subunit UvrA, partial [Elusimicrobia bacterium]|nr:excinuclease ABC subunit UvrA [Elusimicrobiota bacterium]
IEQRNPSRNPRSTVATVTELYDYLRLLYARAGQPHCPRCGVRIQKQSAQAIVAEILKNRAGQSIAIYAPLVQSRPGIYDELYKRLQRSGFVSARTDHKLHELGAPPKLDRYKKHTIELFIDKLKVSAAEKERLNDSVEIALKESRGLVRVEPVLDSSAGSMHSEHHACPHCGLSLPEIEPRLFSFNSPYGACPDCDGLGVKTEVDERLIIPDPARSISEGAITAWSDPVTTRTNRWKRSWSGYYAEILEQIGRQFSIPLDKPWRDLSQKHRDVILRGGGTYKPSWAKNDQEFEGVIKNLERRMRESESDFVKGAIAERFMARRLCPACRGARLKPEALAVKIGGRGVHELVRLSVERARAFFKDLSLSDQERAIARQVLKEIHARLDFLSAVGLDYLTLDRASETLAGGEAQRIHLATQIGSGLTGVMYVLDEPSIGLHPRDNARLLTTLRRLRDLGNTLIVVEHDEETIRSADWVVDLGPGAGVHGGKVVAQGPVAEIIRSKESLTGGYLRGEGHRPPPSRGRAPNGWLKVSGASQFNLKNLNVDIPLGELVCVTGVSGSGKSTLVHEVLYKALAKKLSNAKDEPGAHKAILGVEDIDKVVVVDQTPIGRTPRSNPATYTGLWGPVRDLFAMLPASKARGYKPGRFSFNVKGGRCENCQGDGVLQISMQFLPDVYVPCDECRGQRFNEETLAVRYKGKNIAETLALSVAEARLFLAAHSPMVRVLQTLEDVGLGYIALGQSATTLSGGEAQRVKLATELSRRGTGRTLYILDEPTTGLHFADVSKLLEVLHRLVDAGNTVLVIEHNTDVMRSADWILDLGPEGGDKGGTLVAAGRPADIIRHKTSHTGRFLAPLAVPA